MTFDTPSDLSSEDQRREKSLSAFFTAHGLSGTLYRHPPVFTVAEQRVHCAHIPGAHLKNLVVKDKKGRVALGVVADHKRVDLKAFAAAIGFGRLSFLAADAMTRLLDVEPGSVTPLAVINAPVKGGDAPFALVIDQDLWTADHVAMHPLHNRATLGMDRAQFQRFFDAAGYRDSHRTVLDIPTA